MTLNPYLIYIEVAASMILAVTLVGAGYHFGGLAAKLDLEDLVAQQAQTTADAVLAERASSQAQRERNHQTELTHAQTIIRIDSAPANTAAVFVCSAPSEVHIGTVPGAAAEAGSSAADPAIGGSEPVDRGGNLRPALEALKRRLETIMADYRQEDEEWPTGPSTTR